MEILAMLGIIFLTIGVVIILAMRAMAAKQAYQRRQFESHRNYRDEVRERMSYRRVRRSEQPRPSSKVTPIRSGDLTKKHKAGGYTNPGLTRRRSDDTQRQAAYDANHAALHSSSTLMSGSSCGGSSGGGDSGGCM